MHTKTKPKKQKNKKTKLKYKYHRKQEDVENENGKPGVHINTYSASPPKLLQSFQIFKEEKESHDCGNRMLFYVYPTHGI